MENGAALAASFFLANLHDFPFSKGEESCFDQGRNASFPAQG
jgi:hypothetical protein